jgi:hypothetical protein
MTLSFLPDLFYPYFDEQSSKMHKKLELERLLVLVLI